MVFSAIRRPINHSTKRRWMNGIRDRNTGVFVPRIDRGTNNIPLKSKMEKRNKGWEGGGFHVFNLHAAIIELMFLLRKGWIIFRQSKTLKY